MVVCSVRYAFRVPIHSNHSWFVQDKQHHACTVHAQKWSPKSKKYWVSREWMTCPRWHMQMDVLQPRCNLRRDFQESYHKYLLFKYMNTGTQYRLGMDFVNLPQLYLKALLSCHHYNFSIFCQIIWLFLALTNQPFSTYRAFGVV